MDLQVIFLGTGPSVPTAMRSTAAVLVRRGAEKVLVDCGEGTQRQMQRSTGLLEVDTVLLTHLHADHYLGLPGILKTWDLHGRERPLRVLGPPGLRDLWSAMSRIFGRVGYPVQVSEVVAGSPVALDGWEASPFPVEHRMVAFGYALVEPSRPGRFDPEAAAARGVRPGPDFGRLQAGEVVEGSEGPVRPEDVMGEERPGRKIVITGDTEPCEMTRIAAHGACVLVHDASFADAEAERARETGHSTAREAARIAREADVGLLCLVHVSARSRVPDLVEEAREEFPSVEGPRDFDLVEVPFPERGSPVFVPGGARQAGPPRGGEGSAAGTEPSAAR